jgi:hypothetical protein
MTMQINLEEASSSAALDEAHGGHVHGTMAAILHLHHVPGRLRICLAMLKRNQSAVIPLRGELLAMQGVKSVSVNALTGSVIIYYDRDHFEVGIFWTTLRRLGFVDQVPQCMPSYCTRDKEGAVALEARIAVVQMVMKTLLGAVLEQLLLRSAGPLIRLII